MCGDLLSPMSSALSGLTDPGGWYRSLNASDRVLVYDFYADDFYPFIQQDDE
jgi:hypothetical protein